MISYAQNHEDVVLARAFTGDRGFYIDVGAASPIVHSVTKHFYDRGWNGVNVEPVERWYSDLVAARPRDINLRLGLSDSSGTLPFFDVSEVDEYAGDSTFSTELADHLRARGLRPKCRDIPVTTLAAVCEQHVEGDVDFLKVDVEGVELAVLQGGDWERFRPNVVIVESVVPRTSDRRLETVAFMGSIGYVEVLFDGQNRFFVREESPELASPLSVPANVTDGYEPIEIVEFRQALDRMAAERDEASGEFARLMRERERLESDLALARRDLLTLRRRATDAEMQFQTTREALELLASERAS